MIACTGLFNRAFCIILPPAPVACLVVPHAIKTITKTKDPHNICFITSSPDGFPGEQPECLAIFFACAVDDLLRQFRCRRSLVPFDAEKVIAEELLIEARLSLARLILILGPEA